MNLIQYDESNLPFLNKDNRLVTHNHRFEVDLIVMTDEEFLSGNWSYIKPAYEREFGHGSHRSYMKYNIPYSFTSPGHTLTKENSYTVRLTSHELTKDIIAYAKGKGSKLRTELTTRKKPMIETKILVEYLKKLRQDWENGLRRNHLK